MLKNKKLFQKVTYCMIPFIQHSGNEKITKMENRLLAKAVGTLRGWRDDATVLYLVSGGHHTNLYTW